MIRLWLSCQDLDRAGFVTAAITCCPSCHEDSSLGYVYLIQTHPPHRPVRRRRAYGSDRVALSHCCVMSDAVGAMSRSDWAKVARRARAHKRIASTEAR